jgi:DNA polymerase-1
MPTSETEKLHVYNGLDCCVTLEIFEVIHPQLDNQTAATYAFERELQAPVLEMNMRGILVDPDHRHQTVEAYAKDLAILEKRFQRLVTEGVGIPAINWRSNNDLINLFYKVLGITPVKKRNTKGQYVPTVNREALERLESYFIAQPLVSHLLAMRDIGKKVGVLKTDIDPDGRMRTSYNIAGTTTGRFSSSLSDFGSGTNLQNIEERLRSVFCADPGMKIAYIDLEQAESRAVGALTWNIFEDPRYLDACESGDLHTSVCRLAWTSLPWGDNLKADKAVAEQPFYRQHSYRHMAKVLGHGTNYNGQPQTMAKHTHLESGLIKEFQQKYFRAFPSIPKWHEWVARELRMNGYIDSLYGRRRWFFGRRDDATTVREAIAYAPQSTVGDMLNKGMLEVWRLNCCQLVLQIHDAIVIQYPQEAEDEVLPKVLRAIQVPVELRGGRQLIIPSEAKVGWNWSNATENNPDGLIKYKPGDKRKRQRFPATSLLDRRFY